MPEDRLAQLLVTQAWQIALLTAVVAITVKLLATRRPRLAHLLWLIVVVKCVTPPVWSHSYGLFSQLSSSITSSQATATPVAVKPSVRKINARPDSFVLPFEAPAYQPDNASEIITASSEVVVSQWKPTSASNSAQNQWWSWLWWSIVAGMLVSVVVLTTKFARCLQRIRSHRVTEFDNEIERLVKDLSQQLKLRRPPRVIVSDVRFGPAVLGIFRHLIVLPRCLVEGMIASAGSSGGERSLRPILAHELLHIRRGDLWVGALQAAVRCLWWFHPAVWIVNRMLSRETERCCDDQVVEELGCSPMEYAQSLLTVIESKHCLQPVPVFPGMKPVEITSKRMERIMSLTQGSRTRMSWWSVVAVLLFAVMVLPGAVTGQVSDTSPATADTIDRSVTVDTGRTDSDGSESAVKPKTETIEYELGDLLKQVAEEKSLSPPNARRFLLKDLTQAAGPSCAKTYVKKSVRIKGGTGNEHAVHVSPMAVWRDSRLAVTHDAAGHDRIRQRLAQFRKYGYAMVRIRTTVISGPKEAVDALVTDWSVVPTDLADFATQSDGGIVPVAASSASSAATAQPIQQVGHITESVQKSRPVLLKIVDPEALTAVLEKAQSDAEMNIQKMPVLSAWNGDECKIRDCVIRPFVVGFDDGKPQIRTLADGLTMNVCPAIQDNGILLTCAVEVSEITGVQTEVLSQAVNGKPVSIQVPESRTMRLNAQVRTQPNQTLVIGGLRLQHDDQPEESLLVLIQAERNVRDSNQANATSSTERKDVPKTNSDNANVDRLRDAPQSGQKTWGELAAQRKGVGSDAGVSDEWKRGSATDGITVMGAVKKPGYCEYPDTGIRLLDAIAQAGGTKESADDDVVLRRPLAHGGTAVIVVSLRRAREDATNNLILGPGDVVVVGQLARGSHGTILPRAPVHIDRKMQEKLNQKVSLHFDHASVVDVFQKLAMDCGVNTSIEGRWTKAHDSWDDWPTISKDVDGISLNAALNLLCEDLGLKFRVEHGVINIFLPKPKSRMTARVYAVADLVVPISGSVPTKDNAEPQPVDFSELVELIKTTIEPNTWADGTGAIEANESTLSLVVRQTDEVHEQVMDLLMQLRELQDIQISTEFRVLQFNTPEQLQWLKDNVTFQQRAGSHSWALLPVDADIAGSVAMDGQGKTLSAPKITTFVGQEGSLKVGGGSDFKLTLMSAARPLKGDRLLKLSYAASGNSDGRSQLQQQLVTQIIGNGQTLLLDVTKMAKGQGAFFLRSSMSKAERIKAEQEQHERIERADKARGRIVVAITPKIIRQRDEKELMLLETPAGLLKGVEEEELILGSP